MMIEVYLFLAAFPAQILGMSVLYPVRLARLIHKGLEKVPAERLAAQYPGVDVAGAHERFLVRYRAANTIIAMLGLLLLGWLFIYMRRADWDAGVVNALITVYFVLQHVPVMLYAWFTTRFNKVHRRPVPEARRTATLQRRGLFDFISPVAVVLMALSYLQFAAFMFLVARNPFPGFAGPLVNIGIVTLIYAVMACVVYWVLYGRKPDPLQSHADRMQMIRGVVNCYAWVCILIPLFLSLSIARRLLDLDSWSPFAGSASFLLLSLLSLRFVSPLGRGRDAGGLGSNPVVP